MHHEDQSHPRSGVHPGDDHRRGGRANRPVPASLDAILTQLATWDGGIASEAVWKLRDYVFSRKGDEAGRAECEAKLLQFLKGPATRSAKMAATRLLRVIAGDTAIPALQVMAADPRLSDYGIYVLQPMPGSAAENALVGALTAARGAQKAAIVAALGQRRASSALPLLEPMLRDPALAAPAAVAIGRIGGPAASAALASAYGAAAGESKRLLAASLLEAGDGLLAAKDSEAAAKIFGALAADRSLPAPMRTAAFIGDISAAGPRASTVLVTMLGGDDADARAAAIARIGDIIPPDGIGPVCDLLPRLPDAAQVQVLTAIARHPASRVRPAALNAAKSSGSPDVRVAALRTLESAGDASTVAFLADTAGVRAEGPGAGCGPPHARLVEGAGRRRRDRRLARAAGAGRLHRGTTAGRGRPAHLSREAGGLGGTRGGLSGRAHRGPEDAARIGTPSDASSGAGPSPEVGRRCGEGGGREDGHGAAPEDREPGEPVTSRQDAPGRRERPGCPGDAHRPAPVDGGRGGAARPSHGARRTPTPGVVDAAARAIAEWPTATARDDMLKILRESKDETHRLLAFTGLVRLVSLDANRLPEAAVADLKGLSGLAWRPEEQKLILGALAAFPCQDALNLADGYRCRRSAQGRGPGGDRQDHAGDAAGRAALKG